MAIAWVVRSVDAIAINRAWPRIWKVAVPHLVGVLGELDPFELAAACVVEQAKLDLCRVGGEQRKIDAEAIPRRAARVG